MKHNLFCFIPPSNQRMEGGGEDMTDEHYEQLLVERERGVEGLLRGSNAAGAMGSALSNPPFACKNPGIKERSAAVVARAIVALSAKDEVLNAYLQSLDADTCDTLMKYVVRLCSTASAQSPLYLRLHGLILEKAGMGCLVRCIVDRRAA